MRWSEEELKRLELGVVGAFARGCRDAGIAQFGLLSSAGSTARGRFRCVRVMGMKEGTVRNFGFTCLLDIRGTVRRARRIIRSKEHPQLWQMTDKMFVISSLARDRIRANPGSRASRAANTTPASRRRRRTFKATSGNKEPGKAELAEEAPWFRLGGGANRRCFLNRSAISEATADQ